MSGKNKKIFRGIIVLVLLIIASLFLYKFFICTNNLDKLELSSKNVYVYNLTDNKELLNINGDERVPPASLTKMMTVLVSLENIDDTSKAAPIDKKTYQEMVANNSSMVGFYGNENTTFEDLLYGTMLASGGECANSLAINISGTVDGFVQDMNKKVNDLGLENTNFANSEGMDMENHYSSAKDMSKILEYSINNKEYRKIFTTENYTSTKTLDHPDGITFSSTVLGALDEMPQDGFKIVGGKSGTTDNAGFCWATLSEKKGKEYIVVVMGSDTEEGRVNDTLEIMKNI